jgi:Leucine-rich repeat (LRR) protein
MLTLLTLFLVWLAKAQTPQEVDALSKIIIACDLEEVLAETNPVAPSCSDPSDLIFVCDPDGTHLIGLNLYRGCFSSLTGGILPTQIGQLAWLEYLTLDSIFMLGLPTEIGLLTNLTSLSLSDNSGIFALPTEIGLLQNLQELYLDNLDQLVTVPTQLGNLNQLTLFTASGSGLSPIPTLLGSLPRISTMRLNGCNISSFPTFISSLASLQLLELEDNTINAIPDSIQALTNLTTLSLASSNFQTFPTQILALTQLIMLTIPSLGRNPNFSIPTQLGLLTSLTFLELRANSLKSLPSQIGSLTQLRELDLSKNLLTTLPTQFSRLTGLTRLTASFNAFPEIPTAVFALENLQELYWDTTYITRVPTLIGGLTRLVLFRLNNNLLTALPTQIGKLEALQDLELSSNGLSSLPIQMGKLTSLGTLTVEVNEISSLPTELGNIPSLQFLYAKGNKLREIPTQLGVLPLLRLDLSHNNISRLPSELENIPELSSLLVSNNRLEHMPLYPSLVELDASYNFITSLGNMTLMPQLNSVSMVANKLTGAIPFLGDAAPTKLDLSLNLLTDLETSIQNLAMGAAADGMTELSLAGNLLTGSIPTSIKSLVSLTLLDLSRNLLTSFLAHDRQNFCLVPTPPGLLSLDLSYNQLQWKIQGEADYGSYQLMAGSTPCSLDERYPSTYKNVYTISLYPPLSRFDLSYNYLDDESVTVGFQFVQNENNNFPSLNLVGNRFKFEDSIADSRQFFCAVSPAGSGIVWLEARCTLFPQDFDDCLAGTHNCPLAEHSLCTDGWNPQMSYTCSCASGYQPDLNVSLPARPCFDIDECLMSFPCGNGFKCINSEGGYYCERDLLALAITLPLAIGLIVLFLFFYFFCVLLYRLYQRRRLRHLPPEVSWTWRHAILNPSSWIENGGYLSREFQIGSHEYKRAMDLISTLNFRELEIKSVSAVYNKTLVSGFASTHKVQIARFKESPKVFYTKTWEYERGDKEPKRARVYSKYEEKRDQFGFNKESIVILPTVHGTDLGLAERIAKTGFAALSSVDGGKHLSQPLCFLHSGRWLPRFSYLHSCAWRQNLLLRTVCLSTSQFPISIWLSLC